VSKTVIGLVQMVSGMDVEKNLQSAAELISECVKAGAKMVFLPENFAALASPKVLEIGEREGAGHGPIRQFLGQMASSTKCWISAGTLPTSVRDDASIITDGRVRAASLIYDTHGFEVARYDKIHMFDVDVADQQRSYRESNSFEPGDHLTTLVTPAGVLGLSVCYDIRFPELFTALTAAGAELISIPSAFTVPTGRAHFELLMRSRAVENQVFTIAACQGGEHDSGRETWGHSMVVSPWGEVLGELDKGEDILVVEVDIDEVHRVRADIPVSTQRRLRSDGGFL